MIYHHDAVCRGRRVRNSRRTARRRCRRRNRAAPRRHADRRRAHRVPRRPASPSTRSQRRSGSGPSRLPRNANGKFVKRELRNELVGRHDAPTRPATPPTATASCTTRRSATRDTRRCCWSTVSAANASTTTRTGAACSWPTGLHVMRFDNRDVGLQHVRSRRHRPARRRGVHAQRHGRRRLRRARRRRRRPGPRDGSVDGRHDRADRWPSSTPSVCCR